nr:peptide deformylase [Campylobacter sp.]
MIKEIITYPNKLLFKKSQKVTKFDNELHQLLDDMYETMISSNGIGLAAVQVGVLLEVIVINLADENGIQDKANLLELINPKIAQKTGEQIYQEGCLSVPGFFEEVKRAKNITLEYFDRFGKAQILTADELLSVAIQHEMDHLDGHLFIEKIGYNARKRFDKEFRKNKKSSKK